MNSNVIISSDREIIGDYDLDIEYYLLSNSIDIDFLNTELSLLNRSFLPLNVIYGREIENDFELLVPQKYKDFLNQKVTIDIDGTRYSFVVVGIYNNKILESMTCVYTNDKTFDALFKYHFGSYNYIFVVDNYDVLNKSIDYLRKQGYDLVISDNKNLVKIDKYNTLSDVILLFMAVIVSVIAIFIIYVIL